MTVFQTFISVNNLKKKEVAAFLTVSNAFVTQLSQGVRDVPKDKLALIKANPDWDTSMFNTESAPGLLNSVGRIPLYDDISTIGGENVALINTPTNNASEWINAGDWFPEATAAIRHYGESMLEYPSGSILAIKRVNDSRLIINGRNYVIETTEFRITKQLQYDGDDFIVAYSSNSITYPDGRQIHSPMRIPVNTIRHIDLVLGCVTKEYSNGAISVCTYLK